MGIEDWVSFLNKKQTKQYTVEVSEPQEGEGGVRRHYLTKDRPLIDTIYPKVTTLYENFLRGVQLSGDAPFLGKRSVVDGKVGPYVWTSYNEALTMAQQFGSFLIKRGFAEKTNIGLYSINRIEWVLAEQGCFVYNYNTVPLYDTLGTEAIQYIVNQTEQPLIVASLDKIAALLDLKFSLPSLKTIVAMGTVDEELKKKAESVGIDLINWEDALNEGASDIQPARPPKPDDCATICYTSGTTGLPKGVVLLHKNILSAVMAYHFVSQNKGGIDFTKDDVHLSYLPLAHVFERALMGMVISCGARIGFYQGDTLKLLEDALELKPTFFASVPRLFNRIYDKAWANVKAAGGIKESLFKFAYETKKANLNNSVEHFLFDKIVFAPIRSRLGGRIRFMISGSAPLSPEVMEFLRIAFSCDVLEGYGQTETSAGATITAPGDYSVGHVGAPFPCCEIKLVDIPEMNYSSKDQPFPRGEICFRGHNCFKEYYKSPEKTAEAIDKDGWIHSGDIGMWDAQGRLKVIDRKKNIFKLAQGEYIAPEKIENVYCNNEFIAQAFVYGDSLQATLVAIIVPDSEVLKVWANQNGLGEKSFEELCRAEQVKKHLFQTITQHGKAHDLKGFENVKNIYLEHDLFSVENNLLTPTFKLKRHEVKLKYQKQIDAMYADLTNSSA